MNGQLYCTEAELIADLKLPGREPGLLERIQAASTFLARRIGEFVPVTETRAYLPTNRPNLIIEPCLGVTEVVMDGQAVAATKFAVHPYTRHWPGGPYTRIEHLSDIWWTDVVVSGRWGMYEHAERLGVSLSLTDNETSLTVTDGGLLSPGMVLRVDAEQMVVTGVGNATDSGETLSAAADEADDEVTVSDGSQFYEGEVIQLSTEDCSVRMVRGDTLVLGRGWNGTTKQAHDAEAGISVYRSYTVERAANGTTAAAHSAAAYRMHAPADVNWLTRQMAGLMRMKAAAGFAGRSGNAELGETFYYNEFPGQIKEIARNYRIVRL